jgi:hypothetical protein
MWFTEEQKIGRLTTSTETEGFFTVAPCRVADTRTTAPPALAAGDDRTFLIKGKCGIPATAKSVSLNVTVTQPTAPGAIRLYPTGQSRPLVSNLNYGVGQTRANNAIVPLGADGRFVVFAGQATGTVQFIIDVNGYFE